MVTVTDGVTIAALWCDRDLRVSHRTKDALQPDRNKASPFIDENRIPRVKSTSNRVSPVRMRRHTCSCVIIHTAEMHGARRTRSGPVRCIVLALPIGIISAYKKCTRFDQIGALTSMIGTCTGLHPVAVLGLFNVAQISRFMRSSMLEKPAPGPSSAIIRAARSPASAVLIAVALMVLAGDRQPAVLEIRNASATLLHPLGTNNPGRDTLAQVIAGGRMALSAGIVAMLISIALGTTIGLLAGYFPDPTVR